MAERHTSPCALTTPSATQTPKRKRQLPFSLTQASTVTVNAVQPADQHPAAAEAGVQPTVQAETPQRKRRKPTAIQQPLTFSTPQKAKQIVAAAAAAASAAQHDAAQDPQTSVPAQGLQQQQLGRLDNSNNAPAGQQQCSSYSSKPNALNPMILAAQSKVELKVHSDSHLWGWMLTGEQMLSVSEDQLLQQCRDCLENKGIFAPAAAAAAADDQQQQQSQGPPRLLQQDDQQRQQQQTQATTVHAVMAGTNAPAVGVIGSGTTAAASDGVGGGQSALKPHSAATDETDVRGLTKIYNRLFDAD